MSIRLHPHARERLNERGATEDEVIVTIETGETFPAKFGRTGFRRNFAFGERWKGKVYATKQVEVYALLKRMKTGLPLRLWPDSSKGRPPMRLTYDPRHNIAYLRLQEKTTQVETVRVSESLNVDLAPDGTVYGIELLNANEQLRGREAGKLIVENVATGTSAEVDLLKN
jgi:uncharacterized protein YuzE